MKNQKKSEFAKKSILAAAIIGGIMSLSYPYDADAQSSYNKRATQKKCYNSQGQLTGYGSTCELGGSNCTANPC